MVEFYSKTKYVSSLNGKLRKKLHVEMVKNNKGIRIVGYNNNKQINKTITFLKPSGLSQSRPCNSMKSIKPKKRKTGKRKTGKSKTGKKAKK